MSPTVGLAMRVVIIGPASSGKTTLAHWIASGLDPTPILYDDPAPATIDLGGTWIYAAQSESDVPAEVLRAATTAVFRCIPGADERGAIMNNARVIAQANGRVRDLGPAR